MSTKFEVFVAELTHHRLVLRDMADRLAEATSAAESTTVTGDAFGILCTPIAEALRPLQDRGVRALRSSTRVMEATAHGIDDIGTATRSDRPAPQARSRTRGRLMGLNRGSKHGAYEDLVEQNGQ